jgi:hypothetical protein
MLCLTTTAPIVVQLQHPCQSLTPPANLALADQAVYLAIPVTPSFFFGSSEPIAADDISTQNSFTASKSATSTDHGKENQKKKILDLQ